MSTSVLKTDQQLLAEFEELRNLSDKVDPSINEQIEFFQTFTQEAESLKNYFAMLNQEPHSITTNQLSI